MTVPQVSVKLDFTGSTFGTAFSGTDVSSVALAGGSASPISITWGRQDQYSQVSPTSVSGVFNDATGDFTPGKTGGAHYPHIRRGLHRRIAVTANSTTVNVSDDFATTIEVVPTTDLWTTNISGSDLLARYGGTQSSDDPNQRIPGTALRSMLVEEMVLDTPAASYMLQEEEGSTTFADVTTALSPGSIVASKYGAGVVDAGQQPTTTWDGGSVVTVTNSTYGTWVNATGNTSGSYVQTYIPNLSGVTSYTIEFWVETTTVAPGSDGAVIAAAVDPGSTTSSFSLPFVFLLHQTGTVTVSLDSAHGNASATSSASIIDGGMHQIAATISGTSLKLYIDGAQVGTGTLSGTLPGPTARPVSLGMRNGGGRLDFPFTGAFAYFTTYTTALSATRILSHYNAGMTGWQGESTDARITRLLSYRPNYGSVLDTGLGTMGMQDIQGRSLTDCLLEVGQVEGGVVFVDGLGRVNFRSRSRLFNPSVTATLDCSAGDVSFGGNFRTDTQNVLNDVTVSGSSGAAQRYYDATSISLDGEFSTSISLPIQTDAAALDMAGWMVANGIQEQITIDSLTVNLMTCSAATAAAVVALQPMDVIKVTNIDVNATRAPATTMTFFVQGGQLSLAMDAMSATLNLTPAPSGSSGVTTSVWDSSNWDSSAVWAF